jgi:hypothetical protein
LRSIRGDNIKSVVGSFVNNEHIKSLTEVEISVFSGQLTNVEGIFAYLSEL